MSAWMLQRTEFGWRLPIEKRTVNRCMIDQSFALRFHADGHSAFVRIDGAFVVVEKGRQSQLNASERKALGPALDLYGQVVRSALASDRGELEIVFGDGRALLVKPHAEREAWEVAAPDGMRVVCTRGGTLTVFQARATKAPPSPDDG